MPILRITRTGSEVEAALEGNGVRRIDRRPFSFALSAQDAEDIRWYLEDYRIYPVDPQPKIAKRIQERMAEIGRALFGAVLGGGAVWESLRHSLGDTRIEIETELEDALVPWELMRDPVADLPLALVVCSFIRCHSRPALSPNALAKEGGKIRILLVICRLEGDRVPFRSVARHLIRGLTDAAREPFYLEVLRPPTFEQFARRLRIAKADGKPFHIVHFDGHGLSGEVFFENPKLERNAQSVEASELGKLLHETRVPLLILNACRSADSEPPDTPGVANNVHGQIRQFGSFAHAVMDYGASGVVAWRYSVFVDTAAQYMANLYGALATGLPLGEAATLARKQLSSGGGRSIEDWTVPVVFEAAPHQLFPKAAENFDIKLEAVAAVESGLPLAPDVGFIGRDETILKLDRTFDEQNIVLLYAYAGSGKTSAAAEFVGWYRQTGFSGRALFTSFEQHKTLPRVLDELGRVFESVLAKKDIQWLTLDDAQRRAVALQLLQQVDVFWIWDNVEPISGFPPGAPSAWSAAEQGELLDFLRVARGTKTKLLLTSRRPEREWLHDLPVCVEMPPMPFDECVQMTAELAKKRGRRLEDVNDWRPLVRFTQGNPLTLTVLVSQALRDGLKSRQEIENFVRKLQAGESVFEDEVSEGRTRSLAAALAYGFHSGFTEGERKQLALLHFFQGQVNVAVLQVMGLPDEEWCLPELEGLSLLAGVALLDRAVEAGLLTSRGRGSYVSHPALPWFFRNLYQQFYSETGVAATRAFVGAIARLAAYYFQEYETGNRDVIRQLSQEEANLLHAWNLAVSHGWPDSVMRIMKGLRNLYHITGRTAEWTRIVKKSLPCFSNPSSDEPLLEKQRGFGDTAEFRARLAYGVRDWKKAEQIMSESVSRCRAETTLILTRPESSWRVDEKSCIRSLAASLENLAYVQMEQGLTCCLEGYWEALSLAERIQDSQGIAICALKLGHAYVDLSKVRDLDLAEKWCLRSLNVRQKGDWLGRAKCLLQLGTIAHEQFREAKCTKRSPGECTSCFQKAERYYMNAGEILPANAFPDLSAVYNQLGNLYQLSECIESAIHHYSQAIRYMEAMQDRFGAGIVRYNTATVLGSHNRWSEANLFAEAAVRDFENSDNAEEKIVATLKLLEWIESRRQASSPPT